MIEAAPESGQCVMVNDPSKQPPDPNPQASGSPSRESADSSPEETIPSEEASRTAASEPSRDEQPPKDATIISARPPIHTHHIQGQIGPHELGQTLVGKRLAHFELLEFVGGGGMGAVFRASDTMLNRTVAVKVLSRDQGQDEETVKRFKNEAQSAARLDHDNIARVYFVGEFDGWYFIVFEYIEGSNVRDYVGNHGPMSVEEALNITLQLTEALEHAYNREVVHRDIKPSNVLLTRTGRAKLVDMGLARLQPMRSSENDLTASGVTLGTFDYISPEQARDPRMADVRSDIYSLGCTLFFMLTARPPFPDGTVLQKLLSHSSEAPPDPRILRPDLPDDLIPVISRMLAKRPDDRYQKPNELIGDLLILADRLGVQAATHGEAIYITPDAPRVRWWERHLPWIAPITALLVFVFLIDPIWLQGNTADTQPTYQRPVIQAMPTTEPIAPDQIAESSPPPLPAPETNPDEIQEADDPEGQRVPRALREFMSRIGITGPALRRSTTSDPNNISVNDRVIIVDYTANDARSSDGSLVINDLQEALRLAGENAAIERIELRHNNRVMLDPFSLDLPNRVLTIASGNGYSPVLYFRTGFSTAGGVAESMIEVSQGELQLSGLHFELIVPNDTLAGAWSLFELRSTPIITMRDCTVTVRNTHGGRFSNLDHVSVFKLIPNAIDDMLDPITGAERLMTEVDLKHCIIRGEATVIGAPQADPMRFKWVNGLLVTTERLVSIGGAAAMPGRGEQIMIDLDHVTAVMDRGLGEFTSSLDDPYLIDVSIYCTNNILVTQPWSSLITQSGPQRFSTMQAQLQYFGDRNFYEGSSVFWKLAPHDRSQAETIDFDSWQSQWGENSRINSTKWERLPDKNRPTHEHRVVEYTLGTDRNAAVKSSQDGYDAGFRHGMLPRLPEPRPAATQKTRPFFQN